jgi:hypothetical protein
MGFALYILPGLLVLHGAMCAGERDDKDRRRSEQRLVKLETRAQRLGADASESNSFLVQETRRLAEQCRSLPAGSYKYDRLLEALDDLLDAREDLRAAHRNESAKDGKPVTRDDTAKRLERAYFRLQQGEYFAGLSRENGAPEYISLSRQLYQKARTAYDAKEYLRANRLASASSECVNVLENLAQAAVRKPEPPVLK